MAKLAPKVSVVMSVYNGSNYLKESVESILNQTFSDFEFIIVEDCSTDNSGEIIREYAAQDQRIVIINNEENIGLTKSLNKGLKIAKGTYIARQDADDVALAKRFEKQVEILDRHPDTVLVSCNMEIINPEGKKETETQSVCDPKWVSWYLMFYNHVDGHSQVMFRLKPVLRLGGYCETRRYSQDYELWCRLSKVGKIFILPEILQKRRIHNKSVSAENGSQQRILSLSQSKHNIEQLINQKLTLEEVEYLRFFWVGNVWWGQFPDTKKLAFINFKLKNIYLAYLQHGAEHDFSNLETSRQLRILIGNQFISWIKSVSILNLSSILKITFYTFYWHPLGILGYWLLGHWFKDFCEKLLRKLSFLFQQLTTRKSYL
ncbi:glycosyltransferase [Nostoc sp. FACHB-133]|uniref:glycosyltransferase family 2 protein n=1 Tax=Nostoc sp. FACHB-133 TaxID=2692835 RepID=UPI001688FBE4|nr:glycosyltransferase [Nostoc sp. FACHB-133]MBD2526703.1 glycosyltransferase [Nostoc sp. FACHB-133]